MDSSPSAYVKYVALAATVYFGWRFLAQRARRGGRPLPPGPAPLPFLGNIRDLPAKHEWLTYAEWTKQYGEIVYVEVLGQPIVILGSLKATTELFERRGANCSDRPQLWMMKLCGAGWTFSSMRYGDAWRVRRKAFHTANLPDQVLAYQPGHTADAALFVRQLIRAPADFRHLSRWYIGAVIMRVAYGLKVREQNDPYIDTAERLLKYLETAIMPGRWLVEFLPILRYVPSWFPGAEFQRFAARTRAINEDVRDAPWAALEAAIARGDASASMGTKFVEVTRDEPDRLQVCKDAAAMAYTAGSDTTVAGITNFVLAMVENPNVQARAQAELDAVVGRERLPTFEDRPNLPYLNALVLEVLRWKFITPMGMPHATIQDDEYNGYYIPSGSILLANSWWFMHDPEVFDDPEAFIPERFLRKAADGSWEPNPDAPDPRTVLFGYGRRRCPGLHIAEQSLWAAVACMLATLAIAPAKDAAGAPPPEWSSGVISALRDFPCDICPRDARAEALVHESAAAADARML